MSPLALRGVLTEFALGRKHAVHIRPTACGMQIPPSGFSIKQSHRRCPIAAHALEQTPSQVSVPRYLPPAQRKRLRRKQPVQQPSLAQKQLELELRIQEEDAGLKPADILALAEEQAEADEESTALSTAPATAYDRTRRSNSIAVTQTQLKPSDGSHVASTLRSNTGTAVPAVTRNTVTVEHPYVADRPSKLDTTKDAVAGAAIEADEDAAEADTTSGQAAATAINDEDNDEFGNDPEARRKVALLLELMSAGTALPAKIEAIRNEIDLKMLQVLQRRIDIIAKYGREGGEDGQEDGLQTLYRLLKAEYQRAQASPALRLLDEVFDILGVDDSAQEVAAGRGGESTAYDQRRRAALAAMRSAFSVAAQQSNGSSLSDGIGGNIGTGGIDIFAAAEALAQFGSAEAAAAAAVEAEDALQAAGAGGGGAGAVARVSVAEFVAEATQLLTETRESLAVLEGSIETAVRQLAELRRRDAAAMALPAVRQQVQQVVLAQKAAKERAAGAEQLEDVLMMARSLQSIIIRERGQL